MFAVIATIGSVTWIFPIKVVKLSKSLGIHAHKNAWKDQISKTTNLSRILEVQSSKKYQQQNLNVYKANKKSMKKMYNKFNN